MEMINLNRKSEETINNEWPQIKDRSGFVSKVYGLLLVILSLTACQVGAAMFMCAIQNFADINLFYFLHHLRQVIGDWFAANIWPFLVALATYTATVTALICIEPARRRFPINMFLLFIIVGIFFRVAIDIVRDLIFWFNSS